MKTKAFTLPTISAVDFSVSYVDLESSFNINENESHIHEECEIYLNISGDVSFEVENKIYPISRGSVIITRPYEYHHCIYHSDACHKHYWITFSAERNDEILKIFFKREKGMDNLILLNEKELSELCDLLDEMLSNNTDFLKRRINFLKVIYVLNNGKKAVHTDSIDGISDVTIPALQYIDEHLTEEISVNDIADACNVSLSTLERRFKESLNTSPFAVLRKKRLIASMECLRRGDAVYEAAYKSGFSDYSNYIHLFRKQFGMTPLQYKKKFEEK